MKKFFVNLVCAFIPVKSLRQKVRASLGIKKKVRSIDPWEKLRQNNHVEITETDKKFVNLAIDGINNKVIIKKLSLRNKGKINISLAGDNCSIILDEGIYVSFGLKILMGQRHPNFGKIQDAHLHIGRQTTFENCGITTFNSHAKIDIGKNCMISYGVTFYNTDAHPIYDCVTGKIVNRVKNMKIGDHCWIGANTTILKNSVLANNTILGWGGSAWRVFGRKYGSCRKSRKSCTPRRHMGFQWFPRLCAE